MVTRAGGYHEEKVVEREAGRHHTYVYCESVRALSVGRVITPATCGTGGDKERPDHDAKNRARGTLVNH